MEHLLATQFTDVVFADDAAIFAESLEVLVMVLEPLHEDLGTQGFLGQDQGGVLDETVQSVHA